MPTDTKDDGGPAFPVPGPTELPSNGIISDAYGGMTLRDYFAGQALVGSVSTVPGPGFACWRYYADAAYAIADAMLEARKQEPTP